MREIKFRFWAIEYNRFFSESEMTNFPIWCFNDPKAYGIDINQYTGLKDANGVEIYEGDIIRNCNGITLFDIYDDSKYAAIKWDNNNAFNPGWACFTTQNPRYRRAISIESQEVVGNIYENPELLEKCE